MKLGSTERGFWIRKFSENNLIVMTVVGKFYLITVHSVFGYWSNLFLKLEHFLSDWLIKLDMYVSVCYRLNMYLGSGGYRTYQTLGS